MKRHLVLVGLPGAGKSTVGELVARALKTTLVDVDFALEEATGSTISVIFQREGEERFRAREREAVDAALGGKPCVVVPGGGWAAHPGNLARAEGHSLLVYLSVSPEEAAARIPDDGSRPLLASGNRTARLRELLAVRLPFYAQAGVEVAAAAPPERVAKVVVAAARRLAGW